MVRAGLSKLTHAVQPPKTSLAPTVFNRITFIPRKITLVLGIAALLLVLASVTGQLLKYIGGHEFVHGLVRLFYVDYENTVPSFFAATLLLMAAFLLALIATLKQAGQATYRFQWALLSFTFLFMSIDEAASIHELLSGPVRIVLGQQASGVFLFAWVIPGIAIAMIFGLSYLQFLLHLPRKTRRNVILAATLYLGGAIGMELIGGRYADVNGMENLTYSMAATVEESLEMAGVIVFIYALLHYIADNYSTRMLQPAQSTRDPCNSTLHLLHKRHSDEPKRK
ncbi:MAG: hypothetical protein K8R65_08370 [Nitrospirae bacterium]|nr:hypothetical protein [Nitrospirota bacterium]